MNIILIAVLLFIIAVFVSFIFNKKKEKQYEANFDEDVLKTKKDYKGSLNRYVNLREGKTILRYFPSGKTNTLNGFTPDDDLIVNRHLILFDNHRKIMAIIKDIRNHGLTTSIPFKDIISLQPVEISKKKKVTRGGISPISIKGYRWASSTTRIIKEIDRVYIEIKYHAFNKEKSYELVVFDGILYEDRSKYYDIVEEVNTVINKILSTVAK